MSSAPWNKLINFNLLKKSLTPPKFENIYVYRLKALIKINKLSKISLYKLLS